MAGVGVSSKPVAPGWGWTGLVSGDSGESGHGSVLALLGKHGGPPGTCVAQRGSEEKYARGRPRTLSPLCLPARPCWVTGCPNSLYPCISSSGSPRASSLTPGIEAG